MNLTTMMAPCWQPKNLNLMDYSLYSLSSLRCSAGLLLQLPLVGACCHVSLHAGLSSETKNVLH